MATNPFSTPTTQAAFDQALTALRTGDTDTATDRLTHIATTGDDRDRLLTADFLTAYRNH